MLSECNILWTIGKGLVNWSRHVKAIKAIVDHTTTVARRVDFAPEEKM
jgi:hypothetical protein